MITILKLSLIIDIAQVVAKYKLMDTSLCRIYHNLYQCINIFAKEFNSSNQLNSYSLCFYAMHLIFYKGLLRNTIYCSLFLGWFWFFRGNKTNPIIIFVSILFVFQTKYRLYSSSYFCENYAYFYVSVVIIYYTYILGGSMVEIYELRILELKQSYIW